VCDQLIEDSKLGGNARITVDLERQVVVRPDGTEIGFEIDDFRKNSMLHGLDDIGQTMKHASAIDGFESREKNEKSWMPAISVG
jgi:3-isopropylmalate/(R)-2-methylmalate dehydratase small subunit